MESKRWWQWLCVLLAVLVVGIGVGALLMGQGKGLAGFIVMLVGVVLGYTWLVYGVFVFVQPRYLLLMAMHFGLAALGALLFWSFWKTGALGAGLVPVGAVIVARSALVFRAYQVRLGWRMAAVVVLSYLDVGIFCYLALMLGYIPSAIAVAGIVTMALLFMAGLGLIRLMLSSGHPVLSVARTLLDEAVRMKIALVFILLVLLIVPLLPYANESSEWLKYRIGAFLSWSLWSTSVLLSLMTVFLACGSICSELRDRQIYLTMTKPVSRMQYLLGKWLGIAMLNLLLVAVCGVGIYTYCRMMQQSQARDESDRVAVTDEVLVARSSMLPQPYNSTLNRMVDDYLKRAKDRIVGVDPADTARMRGAAMGHVVNAWHTIAPLESQTYVFTGLDDVKEQVGTVQLKLKPKITNRPDNERIHFRIMANGRDLGLRKPLLLGIVQVIPIATDYIDEWGNLEIRIVHEDPRDKNLTHPGELSFTPDEGLRLLYRYGSFGPNLTRAALMIWVQLCFLAMISLAAGTFLSFPVAALVGMMVYVTALSGGFLTESLSEYAVFTGEGQSTWQWVKSYPTQFVQHLGKGEGWGATKVLIQLLGKLTVALVPSYAKYSPVSLIADGQAIKPMLVGQTVIMVGGIWTGVTGLIALYIFNKRELARVVV